MMSETTTLQKRDEMDQKFCWHMEDLFADDQAWMCAYGKLQTQIDAFSKKSRVSLGKVRRLCTKSFRKRTKSVSCLSGFMSMRIRSIMKIREIRSIRNCRERLWHYLPCFRMPALCGAGTDGSG